MANLNELTQDDLDLLKLLNTGEARLDEINRKQVVQIFTKILRNPTSIKARQWMLSELLKIRKQKFLQQHDKCLKCGVKIFN